MDFVRCVGKFQLVAELAITILIDNTNLIISKVQQIKISQVMDSVFVIHFNFLVTQRILTVMLTVIKTINKIA